MLPGMRSPEAVVKHFQFFKGVQKQFGNHQYIKLVTRSEKKIRFFVKFLMIFLLFNQKEHILESTVLIRSVRLNENCQSYRPTVCCNLLDRTQFGSIQNALEVVCFSSHEAVHRMQMPLVCKRCPSFEFRTTAGRRQRQINDLERTNKKKERFR